MTTLKIRNIAGIKDCIITVSQLMVITGDYEYSKNALMRILYYMRLIESNAANYEEYLLSMTDVEFKNRSLVVAGLSEQFLNDSSLIQYDSDIVSVVWRKNHYDIILKDKKLDNASVVYLPVERASVMPLECGNDLMLAYANSYEDASSYRNNRRLSLPIKGSYYYSENEKELLNIGGTTLGLREFPSDYASIIPIELIGNYYADAGQFSMYVENVEQHLSPTVQRDLMLSIINRMFKHDVNNSLVLTTNSPYVLDAINVLLYYGYAKKRKPDLDVKLDGIDPAITIDASDCSAYHICDGVAVLDNLDYEIPMVSGVELDSVSDWTDNCVAKLNQQLY